jgi:hypothetical protein
MLTGLSSIHTFASYVSRELEHLRSSKNPSAMRTADSLTPVCIISWGNFLSRGEWKFLRLFSTLFIDRLLAHMLAFCWTSHPSIPQSVVTVNEPTSYHRRTSVQTRVKMGRGSSSLTRRRTWKTKRIWCRISTLGDRFGVCSADQIYLSH